MNFSEVLNFIKGVADKKVKNLLAHVQVLTEAME